MGQIGVTRKRKKRRKKGWKECSLTIEPYKWYILTGSTEHTPNDSRVGLFLILQVITQKSKNEKKKKEMN